jgi:hypothetical protein
MTRPLGLTAVWQWLWRLPRKGRRNGELGTWTMSPTAFWLWM